MRDEKNNTLNKTLHYDGVRITISENKFEVSVLPNSEVWEQQAVQLLREWCRWRKTQADMREPSCVPR